MPGLVQSYSTAGAYEPPKVAKERVTTVPSKYKLPTYFRVLIHHVHVHASANAKCNDAFTFAYDLMADADEIVLESTEIQTEVEVETQSTRKQWRRQVQVERWSPVKRRASRVATARKRPTRQLH